MEDKSKLIDLIVDYLDKSGISSQILYSIETDFNSPVGKKVINFYGGGGYPKGEILSENEMCAEIRVNTYYKRTVYTFNGEVIYAKNDEVYDDGGYIEPDVKNQPIGNYTLQYILCCADADEFSFILKKLLNIDIKKVILGIIKKQDNYDTAKYKKITDLVIDYLEKSGISDKILYSRRTDLNTPVGKHEINTPGSYYSEDYSGPDYIDVDTYIERTTYTLNGEVIRVVCEEVYEGCIREDVYSASNPNLYAIVSPYGISNQEYFSILQKLFGIDLKDFVYDEVKDQGHQKVKK